MGEYAYETCVFAQRYIGEVFSFSPWRKNAEKAVKKSEKSLKHTEAHAIIYLSIEKWGHISLRRRRRSPGFRTKERRALFSKWEGVEDRMKKALAVLLCMFLMVSLLPAAPAQAVNDGFYLVGDQFGWDVNNGDHVKLSQIGSSSVFYADVVLNASQGFKIVNVQGGNVTEWWPDGTGNDHSVSETGHYRLYLETSRGINANNCIEEFSYYDVSPSGFYIVGGDSGWHSLDPYYKMSQVVGTSKYISDNAVSLYEPFKVFDVDHFAWYPNSNQTAPSSDETYIIYDTSSNSVSYANKVWVRADGTELVNGTISVNGFDYPGASNWWLDSFQGGVLTINVIPDAGYVVSEVSGFDAANASFVYADVSTNPTTLTIPANSGNTFYVYATFAPAPVASYTVTTSATNGTVSIDATTLSNGQVDEGDTVTVMATPNAGYQLGSITVTNESTDEVTTLTGNTFVMPSANVTVTATFTETDHYYLVTADAPDTLDPDKQFSVNTIDPSVAPYRLEDQRLLAGQQVQVVKVENGVITQRYPGEGVFFEVESRFASDDGNNYSNIDIRFDPVQHTEDMQYLPWTAFGGYFVWEPYATVTIWTSPTYAVNIEQQTGGDISFSTQSGLVHSAHGGEIVTLSVTPAAGFELATLTVTAANGDPVVVTNDSFEMPESPVTISATFISNDRPVLKSVNLSDTGRIGVTFKLTLPTGLAASDVVVELTVGETITETALSSLMPDDNGVYSVSTSLPARKMDTPITIKAKVGNEYKLQGSTGSDLTAGYETSISACCDIYAASANANLAALATAMKTYGAYAHAYLDNAALTNPPALNVADSVFESFSITKPDTLPEGLTLKSMFLTLGDNTSINLRFTIAAGHTIAEYENSFTFGSAVLVPTDAGDSTLVVTIPGIAAADLDSVYSVNVGSGAVACSALYYGRLAMTTNKDALKNAVRALYAYNIAANAYFG